VTTHVALLRGVNVGGRTKVPMADLKKELADLGLEDVVTYIASGNVVFRAPAAKGLATRIEKRIEQAFGVAPTVILRTPAELRTIAKANPYPEAEGEPKTLYVTFLDAKPTAAAIRELDPDRSPPDEFTVHGREIYAHYAGGYGRSKLSLDWFERKLGVRGTARNWRTFLKLIELTEE
jgi:uncharacterized protein (DUF1697 family)